jgi:RNA polymerase sigma-70 factor (ECF subfamily)
MPERWTPVLRVVYLVFNEGYSASSGQSLTRLDLSGEAYDQDGSWSSGAAGARGDRLLALMLLQESRRPRVPRRKVSWSFGDQDRHSGTGIRCEGWHSWKGAHFAALRPYTLRRRLPRYAEAPHADAIDWDEIVGLAMSCASILRPWSS